jgi:TM2 domain-containing membrane protein YozV
MNKVGTAYMLWLGGLVGLAGLHRLYNGQIRTGLLWLFTFGLFGFGQLFDLLWIPSLVAARTGQLSPLPTISLPERNLAIVDLLKAAELRGGKLSVTQGVMATGIGFLEVETLLRQMAATGYVEIGNDPDTGVVVYEFKELV